MAPIIPKPFKIDILMQNHNMESLLQSAQESMRAGSAEKSAPGKKVVDFFRA
jgi:hypothetical protein